LEPGGCLRGAFNALEQAVTAFLDTNVLVYRVDFAAPEKQQRAAQLVSRLYQSRDAVISTQVMQEFYNTLTRKLGISPNDAAIATKHHGKARLVSLNGPIIEYAMQRHAAGQFSFWDALIVEAALAAGCKTLYSEDMRHGLVVNGMTIENPFVGL